MKKSLDYEEKVWGIPVGNLSLLNPRSVTLKYCLEALQEIKGRVLDVGCGAGAMTIALKRERPDLEIIGIDKSREGIKIAKDKKSQVKFLVGDINKLPFKDQTFDAVVCHHVLEHLEEPKKPIKEINRVLKKRGIFYSITPLEGNPSTLHWLFYKIPGYRDLRIKYLGHFQQYSFADLKSLIEENGFKIVSWSWSGFLFAQIIDCLYYPVLKLLGLKPDFLAEVALIKAKPGPYKTFGLFFKNLIYLISNLESLPLRRVPGQIVHLEAIKE